MASPDADKDWNLVLETLNAALKMNGSARGPHRNMPANDWALCGQAASVVIPENESAQTMGILRQLLLREIDKEVKALSAP